MKRLPISSAPIFDDVLSEFFFSTMKTQRYLPLFFGGKWQKCVYVLVFPFHSWKNAQKSDNSSVHMGGFVPKGWVIFAHRVDDLTH